ncbi:NAD-dependent protein deacylase [Atopomonas sediminilitoris]|uniref:NAD-dependent protein deacylase n=1 Tax=Atopomonas sediminilitoris TaxID=2919919 RepID=UPI001F4DE51C|nr:NAD-dependent protein deacylase [Atopomonas sediminilitoris]MCJ8168554.1 NAD-dependent protein deacylase [Atopomonas sediminilitoris]
MDYAQQVQTLAQALQQAERILLITGAGLSADSGLPTYRGMGGLYNGHTDEGMPIEQALSGTMLRQRPELCWKYLAQLGQAVLAAAPNAGHHAIAALQQRKGQCWVLTQNIDGYHRQAGSPAARLIEIHGQLAPLFCQSCGKVSENLEACLAQPLPPCCDTCGGVLRPPVVLFEEMLVDDDIGRLYREVAKGFEVVVLIGTSASFPYILEPALRCQQAGGLVVEINPQRSALSERVDIAIAAPASSTLQDLLTSFS